MRDLFTEEEAAAYLGALIDGEGCVSYSHRRASGQMHNRMVQICNSEDDLIMAIVEACDVLGIRFRFYDYMAAGRKTMTVVISHREGFERIAEKVILRSERKRKKLEEILASYLEPGDKNYSFVRYGREYAQS